MSSGRTGKVCSGLIVTVAVKLRCDFSAAGSWASVHLKENESQCHEVLPPCLLGLFWWKQNDWVQGHVCHRFLVCLSRGTSPDAADRKAAASLILSVVASMLWPMGMDRCCWPPPIASDWGWQWPPEALSQHSQCWMITLVPAMLGFCMRGTSL